MKNTALSLIAAAAIASFSSCSSRTPDTSLTGSVQAWSADKDDTKARIALRNATHKASIGPNRENHEADLIFALENASDPEVKEFMIHELKLIGGTASIEPLSKYLLDDRLGSHACQALLAVNNSVNGASSGLFSGYSVEDALNEALPESSGEKRLHIIKAIGSVKTDDSDTLKTLSSLASSSDFTLKQTALRALSEIADEDSSQVLLDAIKAEKQYRRSLMVSYNLNFAQNLGSSEGEAHALKVMSQVDKNKELNLYIKSLATLQQIKGNAFTDDLISYLDDENLRLSFAVVNLLSGSEDSSINSKLTSAFPAKSPLFQAQALKVLVNRKAEKASFLIGKSLFSKDQYLRSTSAVLASSAKAEDVIDGLINMVNNGSSEDKSAAVEALNRIPANESAASLIKAFQAADNNAKASILSVMASKKNPALADTALLATLNEDKNVRKEAFTALKNIAVFEQSPKIIEMIKNNESSTDLKGLQGALVAASFSKEDSVSSQVLKEIKKGSSAKSNIALIQVLGRIGGSNAYNGLVTLYGSGSETVQKEAVRTLAKWTSLEQSSELLKLTALTEGANRTLMVRGLSTLIVNSDTDTATKKSLLEKLSNLAPDNAEKEKILELKKKIQ